MCTCWLLGLGGSSPKEVILLHLPCVTHVQLLPPGAPTHWGGAEVHLQGTAWKASGARSQP